MKYTGDYTKNISFPLGGIGTGCIGLDGRGALIDWEIFNRPAKGSTNGYSHFAVRAIKDDKIIPLVLNGDLKKDYIGQFQKSTFKGYGYGPDTQTLCGFPHFEHVEFNGEFPVAFVDFKDDRFPANIRLNAFNPFIPRDSDNSSIPSAFFELEIENTTDTDIKYQVAFSVANPYEKSVNKYHAEGNLHYITLSNNGAEHDDVKYGDLTVATDCDTVYHQNYWFRGVWHDSAEIFWNEFSSKLHLKERDYSTEGSFDTCTLMAETDVASHAKKKIRFVLSWNIPNNYNYWAPAEDGYDKKPWKNYYATVFADSVASAQYSLKNWDELHRRTMLFKNTLYNTSIPQHVIDAAASNLSVLKGPTILRLEDGSFYGWEGAHEQSGSCEGTCQHVWNYAYAMCFLFPDLERSIRELEFKHCTEDDGRMGFRLLLPFDRGISEFRACVDGQMGAVIKCYREWKISGDTEWLQSKWNDIKKVLEFAWSDKNPDGWDLDKDGVLEGRQHHTLDVELFGPSSWLEGMYLAALKAAAEMAEYLGDDAKANEYSALYHKGYEWTKENLFNGKYFIHKLDVTDKSITDKYGASEDYWIDELNQIKSQICDGSSIDQMLAQWHADITGLGDIYDKSQIDSALGEMMKINFKPVMRNFANCWRLYSLNDEAGTVICDYPDDCEKPKLPILYNGETMTGFEYSFAGLLLSRGRFEDGFKVVKAVRDRYDGCRRNPWNEFEAGSNYARSMASFALIPILSGFEFDMPNNHIGFAPYKTDDFRCIWSLEDAWGQFETDGSVAILDVFEGEILLKSFGLKFCNSVSCLIIDGNHVGFEFKDGKVYFDEVVIHSRLEITL